MNVRLIRLLLAIVVALVAVRPASAHGPYDSSSQLLILDGALELNTALGMDAARQLLRNAGLSEAEVANALSSRGPSTRTDLSVELAIRFFEISAGGQALKAQKLQVIADGLEANFTATYTGSYSADLDVRARYFDGIEGIRPGAFIAMDENHNIKAVAMLSSAKKEAAIKLSTPAVMTTPKPVEPTAPVAASVSVSNPVSGRAASPEAGSSRPFAAVWLIGVMLGGRGYFRPRPPVQSSLTQCTNQWAEGCSLLGVDDCG